jgi:hypothetical protein
MDAYIPIQHLAIPLLTIQFMLAITMTDKPSDTCIPVVQDANNLPEVYLEVNLSSRLYAVVAEINCVASCSAANQPHRHWLRTPAIYSKESAKKLQRSTEKESKEERRRYVGLELTTGSTVFYMTKKDHVC